MQPYFIPYAGYFRLFAAADVLVMFDCVQFPRRGWVHRNRLPLASGELGWLALPIAKSSRATLIRDLAFAPDAAKRFEAATRRFPILERARQNDAEIFARLLEFGSGTLADYLCESLRSLAGDLGFSTPMVRSSSLQIPLELRGQDRILAIVEQLGAKRYVNAPGGRALYDAKVFAARGVDLRFLAPYDVSSASILTRLLSEPAPAVADEIRRHTALLP
jgi:hypothetical protein